MMTSKAYKVKWFPLRLPLKNSPKKYQLQSRHTHTFLLHGFHVPWPLAI